MQAYIRRIFLLQKPKRPKVEKRQIKVENGSSVAMGTLSCAAYLPNAAEKGRWRFICVPNPSACSFNMVNDKSNNYDGRMSYYGKDETAS